MLTFWFDVSAQSLEIDDPPGPCYVMGYLNTRVSDIRSRPLIIHFRVV